MISKMFIIYYYDYIIILYNYCSKISAIYAIKITDIIKRKLMNNIRKRRKYIINELK